MSRVVLEETVDLDCLKIALMIRIRIGSIKCSSQWNLIDFVLFCLSSIVERRSVVFLTSFFVLDFAFLDFLVIFDRNFVSHFLLSVTVTCRLIATFICN